MWLALALALEPGHFARPPGRVDNAQHEARPWGAAACAAGYAFPEHCSQHHVLQEPSGARAALEAGRAEMDLGLAEAGHRLRQAGHAVAEAGHRLRLATSGRMAPRVLWALGTLAVLLVVWAALHGRLDAALNACSPAEGDATFGVYVCHRVVQMLITGEYAVFPACSLVVREDLQISALEFGLLGTMMYAGNVIGTLISPTAFTRFGHARVCRASLLLAAASSGLTIVTPDKYALLFARFLAGFSHAALYVYVPVWIDCFAPKGSETRWMGVQAVVGVIGSLVAYSLTAWLEYELGVSWRWVFGVIGVGNFVFLLVSGLKPHRLWNVSTGQTPRDGLATLAANPIFWCLTLVVTLQWYVVAGLEWFGVAFLHHIGAAKSVAATLYVASGICVMIAVGIGSWISDRYGGYSERAWSFRFCIGMTLLPLPISYWMLEATDPYIAMALATLFITCFGCINPVVVGLVLRTVPSQKTAASGALNFVSVGVGSMLGPATVGAFSTYYGTRASWQATFWPAILAPFLLTYVAWREPSSAKHSTRGVEG